MDRLKENLSGIFSTKLRSNQSIKQNLRTMSTMIYELKVVGNNLIDEQQVQGSIHSLHGM